MFTLAFWKAAFERALWTFAQALIAVIGVGAVGFGDIDWLAAASIGGVAAVVSILKSIIVNGVTGDGPSITKAEQTVSKDEVVVQNHALFR